MTLNGLVIVVPMYRVQALVTLLNQTADFVRDVWEFRLRDDKQAGSLPFNVVDYDEMEDLERRLREAIEHWQQLRL